MAASVTKTEQTIGVIKKITWAWTSHTDGKVAVATVGASTENTFNGEIVRLVTVPAPGGDAPTTYNVLVYDADNVDVLVGTGATRHIANTEQVVADLGIVANDKLTLYIENAGSGKKGTVHLYIR